MNKYVIGMFLLMVVLGASAMIGSTQEISLSAPDIGFGQERTSAYFSFDDPNGGQNGGN